MTEKAPEPVQVHVGGIMYDITGPLAIEVCAGVGQLSSSPDSFRDKVNRWRTPTMLEIADHADRALAEAWAATQAAHARNAAALDHNARMHALLTSVMVTAQVPGSYRVEVPSRGWRKKMETRPAGYRGDLNRTFPFDDGFAREEQAYRQRRDAYAVYRAKAVEDAERRRAAEENEKKRAAEQRRADIQLAQIILRYQLPEDSDWPAVLENLRGRSKYADLAVAGTLTRGDWSEGFYRVEDALRRFKIETDVDKDIAADLLGCVRADERDGRVFRDTTWNYNRLFELVEAQLAADIKTAMGNIP